MRWTRMHRATNGVDADVEVVCSGCPDAGFKFAEVIPRAKVANKPGHLGERVISRKTIAQGRPDVSAEPVCSCAFLFAHFARETAGAARTRSSLRPLISMRAN